MDNTSDKPSKWKKLVGLVVGLSLVVAGTVGISESEAINNVFVQSGAEQATESVLELQGGSGPLLIKAADTMEAAIQARETSPEKLITLVTASLGDTASVVPVAPVIGAVIAQVNSAYKASDTEEKYVAKLKCIVAGIRSGVAHHMDQ